MELAYINHDKQKAEWKKGQTFSFIIGVLRVILPIIILIYIYIYGYFLANDNKENAITNDLARQINLLDSYISIETPVFVGHNPEKNMNYRSTATTAAKKIDEPDNTFLINTKSIIENNNTISVITSDQGMHNAKNNGITLYQNIILKTDRGLKAYLREADMFLDEGKILSYKPVYIETSTSIVVANDMELRDSGMKLIFRSNPKMKLLMENNNKDK